MQPVEEKECYTDPDCPSQHACVSERCQDLCRDRNPCLGNLQCLVTEDYDGKRNVACACPDGMVAISDSRCEPSELNTNLMGLGSNCYGINSDHVACSMSGTKEQ